MNIRPLLIDILGNTNIRSWKKMLNESQYWSIDKQKDYQEIQLRNLVRHAYKNVPYYQSLFSKLKLKPEDIQSIEDLKKLPILTKGIIKENFNELTAVNYKKFNPQLRKTGGTTGVPFKHFSDINSWNMHWALKYRAWEWGGYKHGSPIGILGGASIIPDKTVGVKRRVWNFLNDFYPLPASNVSENELFDFVDKIKKNKISFLRGYPSSIATLAQFCIDNKIEVNLKSVFTTAEVLREEYKEIIKSAFNCLIIDTYGCADGGGNANTCAHNNEFHVSIEASIWEVCDEIGILTSEMEVGEVTLTSLTNYSMPLFRYQPGDLIENSFNYNVCSCGCTLPRIKKIFGRSTDILKFGNGRSLGGPAFTLLFRDFPILKYQLIQNKMLAIDVNIVPSDNFTMVHENKIRKLMSHHCGEEVEITINKMDNIPLPVSGKHRFIINNTK